MYQTLLKPALIDIKNFVLDTLFPISCLSCGEEGSFICADCKSVISKLEYQRCIVCQKPTPFGFTHPYCQTPYGADGLISFYDYNDEKVSKIIIAGKYNFLPGVFKILGSMAAGKLKNDHSYLLSDNPYELAYVPLHPSRKRWRGFNQAEILCQELSAELNLPVADILQRNKFTKTQKDLKKEARQKNISGAFELKIGADVRNKNIILVDDVTTTGSTLQEAAKILKHNGAHKVICLAIAND